MNGTVLLTVVAVIAILASGSLVPAAASEPPQSPTATSEKQEANEAQAATITGTVSFAKGVRLKKRDLPNVIVHLVEVSMSQEALAQARASRARPVIDQKDMKFQPHVLPIIVGETVAFPNSDPLFHNVFSKTKDNNINLGMYPAGQSKDVVFNTPGIVELKCNVHSEMQAFVVVLAHPYFATADKQGRIRIPLVPPGTYSLRVWHPKTNPVDRTVTVTAGQSLEIDLTITERLGPGR